MTEAHAGAESKYFLLNTDGGLASSYGSRGSGDPLPHAAIGVILRTRKLRAVAQTSKGIGRATHNEAEYKGLIEGLALARAHGVRNIRVYMDSELVVDQMNDRSTIKKPELRELHAVAKGLAMEFESFRLSWVPRELNPEADQLVREALRAIE